MPDDINRSLARGIEILRAYRPGTDLMGNGELAERTGLPRATVSRLTRTLVEGGMLAHDRRQRAYRLAAPVLSLAHAMQSGSPVLAVARPMMQAEAQRRRINVGLAVADRDQMVYLDSVRHGQRVAWRNIVAGQRVPIELTSLGRAWLASCDASARQRWIQRLRESRRATRGWRALERDIAQAVESVRREGFCWASWQPRVVALATPIIVPGQAVHVLNMSTTGDEAAAATVARLRGPLLTLSARLSESVAGLAG
ncbi:MAG: IclR family transcriptional regulator [Lautropia sp.]